MAGFQSNYSSKWIVCVKKICLTCAALAQKILSTNSKLYNFLKIRLAQKRLVE